MSWTLSSYPFLMIQYLGELLMSGLGVAKHSLARMVSLWSMVSTDASKNIFWRSLNEMG